MGLGRAGLVVSFLWVPVLVFPCAAASASDADEGGTGLAAVVTAQTREEDLSLPSEEWRSQRRLPWIIQHTY
jgi:hypothetical protein